MSISRDEVITDCKTGDLLLFNTRTHWYDFLIEKFTNSKFSHVGMIYRDMPCLDCSNVGICLLESGYESFPDVVKNKQIYGVQLADLEEVLDAYKSTTKSVTIYYRKLDRGLTKNEFNILQEAVDKVYAKPYDLLPQDWLKSAFDVHEGNEQRTRTFWCSALVAYLYDQIGFIKRDTPWTIIQPTQFSFYEGKQLQLQDGINLSPEKMIVDF